MKLIRVPWIRCRADVLRNPLKTDRLFEAVAKAAMLGRDLHAEIQILGLDGLPVEVLNLDSHLVFAD